MSLKKIEQVKNTKWFKPWDLLVYGLLAAIIVALILVFALSGKDGELDGITISYRGEKIFNYYFSQDAYEVLSADNIEVKEEDDGLIELIFYTDGRGGFNNITIDKKGRSVKVTASNCSTHKDCVYTQALSSSRSVPILCTPHALSIAPITIYDDGVIRT